MLRAELDQAALNSPAYVMDCSYHACYANSAALMLVGIGRATPDPHGGEIRRDADGEAKGMLWERAMNLVHQASMHSHIDLFEVDVMANLVEQNARRHLSHGITSVGDAVITPESAELYRLADERGKLPIMIYQVRGGQGFFAAPEEAASGPFLDDNVSDPPTRRDREDLHRPCLAGPCPDGMSPRTARRRIWVRPATGKMMSISLYSMPPRAGCRSRSTASATVPLIRL